MLIRYEDCKDRLEIRLCDPEINPERIKNLPVIYVGDWSGYFAVNVGSDGEGMYSFNVNNNIMEYWGITVNQLYRDALVAMNKEALSLFDITDTRSLLEKSTAMTSNLYGKRLSIDPQFMRLFAVTNRKHIYGAGCIANHNVRKSIGDSLGYNYFVIPSSIHELMIVPDCGYAIVEELKLMVHEVNYNSGVVSSEDILSDKVMWCSKDGYIVVNADNKP